MWGAEIKWSTSYDEARKQAKLVAQYESEHLAEARQLVALLGGAETVGDRTTEPENFVQAREAGREAVSAR